MSASPWGGSEELWSQAALHLAAQGVSVGASVCGWSPPHQRVLDLLHAGVKVQQRARHRGLLARAWQRVRSPRDALTWDVEKCLGAKTPALIILSAGGPLPPVELAEMCDKRGLPFVTVGHGNSANWWPNDKLATRYRKALSAALRCFFVSHANKTLAEKQLGGELFNAEVIRNPFNVPRSISLPWPYLGEDGELRLACVGRLDPSSKGQDILLEALAKPSWIGRNWRLHLYGDGPARNSLEWLVRRLRLTNRVVFAGYVPVEEIWKSNHVLVMPCRRGGLPLAIVEAMMCARPVIATDVAGHSEVIKDGVTGFLADAPTVRSVGEALERSWARRTEFEGIGQAAAKSIREFVPTDPVDVFSNRLKIFLHEIINKSA